MEFCAHVAVAHSARDAPKCQSSRSFSHFSTVSALVFLSFSRKCCLEVVAWTAGSTAGCTCTSSMHFCPLLPLPRTLDFTVHKKWIVSFLILICKENKSIQAAANACTPVSILLCNCLQNFIMRLGPPPKKWQFYNWGWLCFVPTGAANLECVNIHIKCTLYQHCAMDRLPRSVSQLQFAVCKLQLLSIAMTTRRATSYGPVLFCRNSAHTIVPVRRGRQQFSGHHAGGCSDLQFFFILSSQPPQKQSWTLDLFLVHTDRCCIKWYKYEENNIATADLHTSTFAVSLTSVLHVTKPGNEEKLKKSPQRWKL